MSKSATASSIYSFWTWTACHTSMLLVSTTDALAVLSILSTSYSSCPVTIGQLVPYKFVCSFPSWLITIMFCNIDRMRHASLLISYFSSSNSTYSNINQSRPTTQVLQVMGQPWRIIFKYYRNRIYKRVDHLLNLSRMYVFFFLAGTYTDSLQVYG